MGKLRVLSAREVCQILAENGFVELRQRGSHIIMQLKTEETTITVPIPNYAELKSRAKNWNFAIYYSPIRITTLSF